MIKQLFSILNMQSSIKKMGGELNMSPPFLSCANVYIDSTENQSNYIIEHFTLTTACSNFSHLQTWVKEAEK